MWLMSKNKILTKMNLLDKGWQGDSSCQFCPMNEDSNHLFFQCYFARAIWFSMGHCQEFSHTWSCIDDVLQFAYSLPKIARSAFLIVVSAVIWCIWKRRNDICFNNSLTHPCRSTVMTIVSLIISWTGTQNENIQTAANEWMPQDMDEVPIQIIPMEEDRMVEMLSADAA